MSYCAGAHIIYIYFLLIFMLHMLPWILGLELINRSVRSLIDILDQGFDHILLMLNLKGSQMFLEVRHLLEI